MAVYDFIKPSDDDKCPKCGTVPKQMFTTDLLCPYTPCRHNWVTKDEVSGYYFECDKCKHFVDYERSYDKTSNTYSKDFPIIQYQPTN